MSLLCRLHNDFIKYLVVNGELKFFAFSGPGKAWSAKEQGEFLFKLAKKKPWLIGVPVGLMDGIISIFDTLTKVFPNLEVSSLFQIVQNDFQAFLCQKKPYQQTAADCRPKSLDLVEWGLKYIRILRLNIACLNLITIMFALSVSFLLRNKSFRRFAQPLI